MIDRTYGDELSLRARLSVWAVIVLIIVGLPVAAFLWMTSVPGESYRGSPPVGSHERTAMATRLRADVIAIASQPHNLKHQAALLHAEHYLQLQLAAAGYAVQAQDVLLPARNLEVVLHPHDEHAATIVVGAHYDSFFDAPGANDNGSGTAALLEIARALKPFDGKLAKRVRLIFFVNEEPPFFKTNAMGSKVSAQSSAKSGERIDGMISLETMGYFDDRRASQHYPFPLSIRYPDAGNFITFVGDLSSRNFLRRSIASFRSHTQIPSVGGTAPAFIQGIEWSDHWAYSKEGVPAFMVTDTAPFRYPHYHSKADLPDKLDYDRLALVVEGLKAMLLDLAGDR